VKKELLNSDAKIYGGSGQGNRGGVEAAPLPMHRRYYSLSLDLPPLGAFFLNGRNVSFKIIICAICTTIHQLLVFSACFSKCIIARH